MQADRFTVKSQEAVAAAQRLGAARRNTEVAPAHLLLALLDQEDGLVVPVLRRLDADVAAVRSAAAATIERLATVAGDAEPEVRPSSSFVRVLQRAEREAASRGDEYISTDHMLLALADTESGVADALPARDQLATAIEDLRPERVTS